MSLYHKLADGTILNYDINQNGKIGIVGVMNTTDILRIPKYIDDLPVDEIYYRAFARCGFKKVILPNSLTFIASQAFAECVNLKEINLPKSLTRIRSEAFLKCESLESIEVPKHVSFETGVFKDCHNLQKAKINNARILPYQTFTNCGLKELYLPDNLSCIDDSALSGIPKRLKIFANNNLYLEEYSREHGYRYNYHSELNDFLSKVSDSVAESDLSKGG